MPTFVALALLMLVASGCSGERDEPMARERAARPDLVPPSAELRAECQRTADAVGYAVPCPTRVPAGLVATKGIGGCEFGIIGPGGEGGCSHAWRGWVVGSSETSDGHLVIVSSPRALRDPAKVVNGPGWYPGAHVRLLRHLTINGWRVKGFSVPSATNEGSAFSHHAVLIWTTGGHTYAVGFHNVDGLPATFDLDVVFARAIRLVPPRQGE
jgi:hypothetical protein